MFQKRDLLNDFEPPSKFVDNLSAETIVILCRVSLQAQKQWHSKNMASVRFEGVRTESKEGWGGGATVMFLEKIFQI